VGFSFLESLFVKTIIEPFKIKMVEPIKLTTREQREAILRKAYFNVFQVPAEDRRGAGGAAPLHGEVRGGAAGRMTGLSRTSAARPVSPRCRRRGRGRSDLSNMEQGNNLVTVMHARRQVGSRGTDVERRPPDENEVGMADDVLAPVRQADQQRNKRLAPQFRKDIFGAH
jgi:hypothetical protein